MTLYSEIEMGILLLLLLYQLSDVLRRDNVTSCILIQLILLTVNHLQFRLAYHILHERINI